MNTTTSVTTDKAPTPTVVESKLEQSLRDVGIPPRPLILERVGEEMRKEEPNFRYLGELISADVSLAAGLLKTANSSYFGFRSRARTVTQALVMLGLNISSRAIAGLVLRKVFLATPAMERFWDVSARVARVSGWLVGRLGVRDGVRPDDAYTFGLFRDCGIPILMKKFPQYVAILKEADADLDRVFTDVEQVRCPTNHAIVGSLMAQNWWLPEETSEAIRCHHDAVILASGPLVIAPASARMVALAQLAEFLVQRIDGQSTTREWDKLGCTCRQLLALDAEGAEALLPEAEPVVRDTID